MNVKRHYQTKHANSHFLSESNHAEKPFTESVYQRLCYEICEWKVHLFCSGLNTPNYHNNTNGCIIKYKMFFFFKNKKNKPPQFLCFEKGMNDYWPLNDFPLINLAHLKKSLDTPDISHDSMISQTLTFIGTIY